MIICLLIGSIALAFFAFFFLKAGDGWSKKLNSVLTDHCKDRIETIDIEFNLLKARVMRCKKQHRDGDPKDYKRAKKLTKQKNKLEKQLAALQKGGCGIEELPTICGYAIAQTFMIGNNMSVVNNLHKLCIQYKENYKLHIFAEYLVAKFIGNAVLGVALAFIMAGFGMAVAGTSGAVLGLLALMLLLVNGYLPIEALQSEIKHRTAAIEHEFPRAVSKLTMLSVSGIALMKAWELTAESGVGVLYSEMRRVCIALDNATTHNDAFTGFIERCANPSTTKLATLMMQNYKTGDMGDIQKIMRSLNSESWSDYKNAARRKGGLVSGKLMVPTMLTLVGIIILIVVPAFTSLNI